MMTGPAAGTILRRAQRRSLRRKPEAVRTIRASERRLEPFFPSSAPTSRGQIRIHEIRICEIRIHKMRIRVRCGRLGLVSTSRWQICSY